MVDHAASKQPAREPEPHWCPGCWVEMPPGSEGKCQPCLDWLCRGPSDDEACWGSKPFPHDWAAPIRAADRQYHGDYYRA